MLAAALVAGSVGCGEPFASSGGDAGAGGTSVTTTGGGTGGGGAATGGTGAGAHGAGGTGGHEAGGAPCHPPGLEDDFSGSELNPLLWESMVDGAVLAVGGGSLYIEPFAHQDGDHYTDVYTLQPYDLSDCSVWIEVPGVLHDATPGETYFMLWVDDANNADITVLEGILRVRVRVNGVIAGDLKPSYDPVAHRWWRYREQAGTTYLETSADGTSWTSRLNVPSPWYMDAVGIGVGVATWGPTGASPGRAEFDNVDLLP